MIAKRKLELGKLAIVRNVGRLYIQSNTEKRVRYLCKDTVEWKYGTDYKESKAN